MSNDRHLSKYDKSQCDMDNTCQSCSYNINGLCLSDIDNVKLIENIEKEYCDNFFVMEISQHIKGV